MTRCKHANKNATGGSAQYEGILVSMVEGVLHEVN